MTAWQMLWARPNAVAKVYISLSHREKALN